MVRLFDSETLRREYDVIMTKNGAPITGLHVCIY